MYLIFTRRGIDINDYPSIKRYLLPFKDRLMPKPKGWKGENWKGRKPGAYKWYEMQDTIDYHEEFEKHKFIFPDIAKESRMSFDKDSLYIGNTGYIIPVNDLYLLGLLNSKLIFTFYKRSSMVLGDPDKGGRLRWIYQDVIKIPIRVINLHQKEDILKQLKIEDFVKQMLQLNENIQKVKTSHKK